MKNRVIFHVDVNSAFLSWSAVHHLLMGGAVDYRKINAAVAKEGAGKSIILAKSEGAKKRGVVTGEPIWQAREKCPDLQIVNPNYSLYLQASRSMKQLLFDYSPFVETYSIDECFLDMTGQEKFFGPPKEAAYIIKERLKKELGFTVNVGMGENKPLAKMASEFQKPDRIHTLWVEEIKEKLWPLPLSFLFMAGRQSVKKMQKIGVDTVGKLARLDQEICRSLLGKQGVMLHCYANGIDDDPVLPGTLPPPKSISQSVTLPQVVTDKAEVETILIYILEHLVEKLRKQQVAAAVVSVAIKDENRIYHAKQLKTGEPLLHRRTILSYVFKLLQEIWPDGGVRYVGMGLSDFKPDTALHNSLFNQDICREDRLDEVVYSLKRRYGHEAILPGRLLHSPVKNLFRDFDDDVDQESPRFF